MKAGPHDLNRAFYVVCPIIIYPMSPLEVISTEHYEMFHGRAARNGREDLAMELYWLGMDLRHPLSLSRSGVFVPDVFSPTGVALIVSEIVKRKLESLSNNMAFLQVRFSKLVNFSVAKRDFRMMERWIREGVDSPAQVILRLPDEPLLHHQLGPFYEVIVARDVDILSRWSSNDLYDLPVDLPETAAPPTSVNICINQQVLREYPILWAAGSIVMSEQAFRILDKHIDRDYYSITEAGFPSDDDPRADK